MAQDARTVADAPPLRTWLIALGANLGDPRATLPVAWRAVVATLRLRDARLSPLVASDPAEGCGGPQFCNAVGRGRSDIDLRQGLSTLLAIEAAFGRDRARQGDHGPRTLDLDVLAVDDLVSDDPELTLPHPRMHRRVFVLEPLAAVCPEFVHPRTGLTLAALLRGVAVGMLLLTALGCRHPPEPPTPLRPPGQPPADYVLAEVPLDHTPSLDRALLGFSLVGADQDGLDVLRAVAPQFTADDLRRDTGARRTVAWAVYREIAAQQLGERFAQIRTLVDTLQAAAPGSPEARFCRALLRLVLIERGEADLRGAGIERSVLVDLRDDLQALVALGWSGPAEYDAARLAHEAERVDRLLAAWPVHGAAAAPASDLPGAATP